MDLPLLSSLLNFVEHESFAVAYARPEVIFDGGMILSDDFLGLVSGNSFDSFDGLFIGNLSALGF